MWMKTSDLIGKARVICNAFLRYSLPTGVGLLAVASLEAWRGADWVGEQLSQLALALIFISLLFPKGNQANSRGHG